MDSMWVPLLCICINSICYGSNLKLHTQRYLHPLRCLRSLRPGRIRIYNSSWGRTFGKCYRKPQRMSRVLTSYKAIEVLNRKPYGYQVNVKLFVGYTSLATSHYLSSITLRTNNKSQLQFKVCKESL